MRMKTKINLFFVWGPGLETRSFFNFMRILTVVVFALTYLACTNKPDDISTQVYTTGKGFAYRIYIGNKIAIQQESVPGMRGDKPFCDKASAERTAALVKSKILKRQNPSVTSREIDSLKIRIKC